MASLILRGLVVRQTEHLFGTKSVMHIEHYARLEKLRWRVS